MVVHPDLRYIQPGAFPDQSYSLFALLARVYSGCVAFVAVAVAWDGLLYRTMIFPAIIVDYKSWADFAFG